MPGLSAALAEKAFAHAERWATDSDRAELLERAEAFERGEPMTVSGWTVWQALSQAGSPHEHFFFQPPPADHDAWLYEITGRDEIRPAEQG